MGARDGNSNSAINDACHCSMDCATLIVNTATSTIDGMPRRAQDRATMPLLTQPPISEHPSTNCRVIAVVALKKRKEGQKWNKILRFGVFL